MSRTAKGKRTHTCGFLVEFLPAKESQEPLAVGDDSNLDAPPLNAPRAHGLAWRGAVDNHRGVEAGAGRPQFAHVDARAGADQGVNW